MNGKIKKVNDETSFEYTSTKLFDLFISPYKILQLQTTSQYFHLLEEFRSVYKFF